MAEGKKSFLLYCDLVYTVSKLTDDKAGKLFKHVLNYVNDNNPCLDDYILELVFEPIKQSLKRDLKRYESIVKSRKKAGLASANKRKQKSTLVDTCQQVSTNPTDSDNDSVSDIIKNKDISIDLNTLLKDKDVRDAFTEYLDLRKKWKLVNSERVVNRLVKKLREYSENKKGTALEIIDKAITGKWKDFYPLTK